MSWGDYLKGEGNREQNFRPSTTDNDKKIYYQFIFSVI